VIWIRGRRHSVYSVANWSDVIQFNRHARMHAMTTTKEKTDIKPSTDGRTDANTVTVTVGGG